MQWWKAGLCLLACYCSVPHLPSATGSFPLCLLSTSLSWKCVCVGGRVEAAKSAICPLFGSSTRARISLVSSERCLFSFFCRLSDSSTAAFPASMLGDVPGNKAKSQTVAHSLRVCCWQFSERRTASCSALSLPPVCFVLES